MVPNRMGQKRRPSRTVVRALVVVIFILAAALCVVSYLYLHNNGAVRNIDSALTARTINETKEAQSAIYSLTQSSGTNTTTLLAMVRSHVYALQCLNMLAANIYGPGTSVASPELLAQCMELLDQAELRLRAGLVITEQTSAIRLNIDQLVAAFGGA